MTRPRDDYDNTENSSDSLVELAVELQPVVYLSKLSASCSRILLWELLHQYFHIVALEIHFPTYSNTLSERYAIATFSSSIYAEEAVESLNGHFFMGRHLR